MKNYRVMLFGALNCEHSKRIHSHLLSYGCDVNFIARSKKNNPIPANAKNWKGDFIFVFRTYYILPKEVISSASIAAINFHPGPPNYPGSGGYNWALYNNDRVYGVTAHLMNEKIDNGPILSVHKFSIDDNDNVETLVKKTLENSEIFICDFIDKIFNHNNVEAIKFLPNESIKWSGLSRRMADIDQYSLISRDIDFETLKVHIRSFHTKEYPLKLKLFGHIFELVSDDK